MIEVNERFQFKKDTHGWQLHDWKMGEDKDGNHKRQKRTTYHSNLKQICAVIIDRIAGQCSSLQGIVGMLESAEAILTQRVGEEEKNLELLNELNMGTVKKTINDIRKLLDDGAFSKIFSDGGEMVLDEIEERLGLS